MRLFTIALYNAAAQIVVIKMLRWRWRIGYMFVYGDSQILSVLMWQFFLRIGYINYRCYSLVVACRNTTIQLFIALFVWDVGVCVDDIRFSLLLKIIQCRFIICDAIKQNESDLGKNENLVLNCIICPILFRAMLWGKSHTNWGKIQSKLKLIIYCILKSILASFDSFCLITSYIEWYSITVALISYLKQLPYLTFDHISLKIIVSYIWTL